jgi:hypothetical protein
MEASERVTWEDCPCCRRAAAVGWVDGRPVEFDCPRGCHLSAEQVQAFAAGPGLPTVEGQAPGVQGPAAVFGLPHVAKRRTC